MSGVRCQVSARIRVNVTPGAKRDEIVGWRDDVLRVRVRAAPQAPRGMPTSTQGQGSPAQTSESGPATATIKDHLIRVPHLILDLRLVLNGERPSQSAIEL
ncbi:MAG: DUF167 domain-containing protein [Chloroflexi bacterium]|nr:MAG: DUF167 domain-containing protein [Chloroflexota bacterium]